MSGTSTLVALQAAAEAPVVLAPAGLALLEPRRAASRLAPLAALITRRVVVVETPGIATMAMPAAFDVADAGDVAVEAERTPLAVAMPGMGLLDETSRWRRRIERYWRGGSGREGAADEEDGRKGEDCLAHDWITDSAWDRLADAVAPGPVDGNVICSVTFNSWALPGAACCNLAVTREPGKTHKSSGLNEC